MQFSVYSSLFCNIYSTNILTKVFQYLPVDLLVKYQDNRLLQTSYSVSVYQKREPPDGQDGLRKGRGTREQIANICWIIEKAKEFQKKIYF